MPTIDKEDPTKVRKSAVPDVEHGETGTYIINGILSNIDYNSDLVGTQGIDAYKEMRNDGTVRASLWAIKTPLLRANWFVKAASDDPKHIKHQELIEQELFGVGGNSPINTFTEFLREALNYLEFGRYLFEINYRLRPDGLIGWERFAPRLPETVWKWEQENGEPGITQMVPMSGNVSIPLEKLLILVNEKEGSNYEGRSILRSSYFHWFVKNNAYKIEAMAIERQGMGVPVITHPDDATPDEIAKAKVLLKNVRANNKAHLVFKAGWKFEFANMGGGTRIDPSKAIQHHDRQILKNVLAQFIDLGSNQGSYALSKDQSSFFLLAEQYIADYLTEAFNKQLVRRLIDVNFGEQEFYPEIMAPEIGSSDHSALTASYQRLVQVGGIIPNSEDDKWFRDVMGLAEAPDGFYEEVEMQQFMEQMLAQEAQLDAGIAQEDATMAAEDEMETMDEELPEDEIEANSITLGGVMAAVFGAFGQPRSDETKSKISESLKKYWASRRKGEGGGAGGKKGKGGKGKKGKDPKKAAEQAANKAKREEAKQLRRERRDKIKEIRETLRKDREGMQIKMLELKAKGEPMDKEAAMKMQIDMLKKRSAAMDTIAKIDKEYTGKIDKVTGTADVTSVYAAALKIKGALDHAEATITGKHNSR
jgi:hypothetical protein